MTNSQKLTTSPIAAEVPQQDPRLLFRRAAGVTATTIDGVRPEQMDLRTPCEDFDVRALLGHLIAVVGRAAAIGRGRDAMALPAAFTYADDAWSKEWAEAAVDADDAWQDDAALQRVVVLPWATLPGGEALLGYLNELVVHTWDLAQATDQHPMWDDEVVGAAYQAISHVLPAEHRPEIFEVVMKNIDPSTLPEGFRGAPFAEAVEVSAAAAPIDRLVAYNGRNPQ